MENLTETERDVVGLALFTFAMKLGPTKFDAIEKIIQKLEVTDEFVHYAKDWIKFSTEQTTAAVIESIQHLITILHARKKNG